MSTRIVDTAVGNVEIEDRGSGTPVLVVHGSPGGIDAGRAMGRFLPADRFRTIAVSRPGYLGTPLLADPSIDGEADLFAALLDALGVDRVGVLAWSGGGPSSYRLAVRHPERVSSLIEVAALSTRWVAAAPPLSERLLFGSAAGNGLVRFLVRRLPNQVVEGALASEGALRREELKAQVAAVLADPAQRAAVLAFATTVSFIGGRRAGWQNDVANFAAIDSLELERVSCPVLLIHGNADSDATIDFSYSARDALPHSRLIVMDRGTHLAFYAHPDAATVQEEARAFLSASA